MSVTVFQVDAFTDKPFAGNPAGVCLLREPRGDRWMQDVAAEMNVSETAFLLTQDGGYNLRWFTPTVEVDLCGHATLASAHVLWEQGLLRPHDQARFHTRSGLLSATRQGDRIEMDFPAEPAGKVSPPAELVDALGITPVFVGKSRSNHLVELDSEQAVRDVQPDLLRLARLPGGNVMVTARADSNAFDFVSRYFAPACGIDEDPVTGSAHCCLGPHWQARLNRDSFVAYQASRRGGIVHVRVSGDRVLLGGQAVTIFRAELNC